MAHPENILPKPDHPILEPIRRRWSPYRFLPKAVEDEKLLQCLEAARWAASSYNEQPWSYLVARRQEDALFSRALGCLVEANQAWAKNAGVLLLSVVRPTFRRNGKPNRVALHDLGAAAAHLALQAVPLGLAAHQMAGVNPSVVRSTFAVPESHTPETAIALGYPDLSEPDRDDPLAARDASPRERLSLREQIFGDAWGVPADWLP